MINDFGLMPYSDVLEATGKGRTHLLLGNGFSIACDPIFRYDKLYDAAVRAGLSSRAQQVFHRLGTNNFESAMRLLDDGHWLANTYGLLKSDRSEFLEDLDVIKRTLVEAVANSQLANTSSVPDEKKRTAAEFLKPFHFIFSANYDLLLYWVNMSAGEKPPFGDGFRSEWADPDAETVVFTEHLGKTPGIFFIHGALHLFVKDGEVRKHCWCRSNQPLTRLIREGLESGKYPLFVAEGKYEQKLEQIHRSSYLSYCLSKLGRIENKLVVLGLSFGESDTHLLNAIADNRHIEDLFVGVFGGLNTASGRAVLSAMDQLKLRRQEMSAARRGLGVRPLTITFFDSSTARVWK